MWAMAMVRKTRQYSRRYHSRSGIDRDHNCGIEIVRAGCCIGDTLIRVRPRFFEQVGHETMYASSGNKKNFAASYHRQTYLNYEQSS